MVRFKIEDFFSPEDLPNLVPSQEYAVAWVNDRTIPHNGVDVALRNAYRESLPHKPFIKVFWAEGPGVITRASYHFTDSLHAYGNRLSISFDTQFELYIAHLEGIFPTMRVGKEVGKGELLGFMGDTGAVTGPHFHFGIRDKNTGEYWNPHNFIDFSAVIENDG